MWHFLQRNIRNKGSYLCKKSISTGNVLDVEIVKILAMVGIISVTLLLLMMNGAKNLMLTLTDSRFKFNSTEGTDINLNSSRQCTYLCMGRTVAEAVASYATSYIPTSGSAVTRSADVANNSGNADLFNDSEGVLYAEIAALVNDLSVRSISISDGSLDNSIRIAYQNVSNNINFRIRANGTSSHSNNRDVSDITEFAKVAYKYKSGDSSAFINGFKRSTLVSSFAFTNTLNQLRFENGSGSQDFYGNTKELAVFKEALTDAELESLTSWVSFTQMATDLEYTLE